jgi:hypothetical protein
MYIEINVKSLTKRPQNQFRLTFPDKSTIERKTEKKGKIFCKRQALAPCGDCDAKVL